MGPVYRVEVRTHFPLGGRGERTPSDALCDPMNRIDDEEADFARLVIFFPVCAFDFWNVAKCVRQGVTTEGSFKNDIATGLSPTTLAMFTFEAEY